MNTESICLHIYFIIVLIIPLSLSTFLYDELQQYSRIGIFFISLIFSIFCPVIVIGAFICHIIAFCFDMCKKPENREYIWRFWKNK